MSAAEDVVQRQVEAYDAHDIDRVCACYAKEVAILGADGEELVRGLETLRERYGQLFAEGPSPEILGRMCLGSWVVDQEPMPLGDRVREGLVVHRAAGDVIDVVHVLTG